ncbi:Uncharacterised protein [Mycobacterium tuberculosis]|nr:Uncharacterised protein [Mycobacterium tuberculosis]
MASDSGRFRHISSMRESWKSLLAMISGVSGSSSRYAFASCPPSTSAVNSTASTK